MVNVHCKAKDAPWSRFKKACTNAKVPLKPMVSIFLDQKLNEIPQEFLDDPDKMFELWAAHRKEFE